MDNLIGLDIDKEDNRIVFTGNTYPLKDVIKQAGAYWNPDRKRWECNFNTIKVKNIVNILNEKGILVSITEDLKDMLHNKIVDDSYLKLLKHPPYPYQKEGIEFLYQVEKGVLADEPGLGKTFQVIASYLLISQKEPANMLIFCPSAVKEQWKNEFDKFYNSNDVEVVKGSKTERQEIYHSGKKILILNYELLHKDIEDLITFNPYILVMDEASKVKNRKSKVNKNLYNLVKETKPKYIWALTGTPLENRLEELYAVFKIVDEDIFGYWKDFERDYILYDIYKHSYLNFPIKNIVGYKNLNKLKKITNLVVKRRRIEDVLDEIPPIVENMRMIEFGEKQFLIYRNYASILESMIDDYVKHEGKISKVTILSELNVLKMICDSTELLTISESPNANLIKIDNIYSSKLEDLDTILEEEDRKTLIFTEYSKMARIIVRHLNEKQIKGEIEKDIRIFLLTGEENNDERQKIIDEANNSEKAILVSTDCMAYGVNLQTFNVVVNFDIPWNPAKLRQRIGRVYRIGQKKHVTVFNMIVKNSVEENILNKLYNKKLLFENVVDDESSDDKFVISKFSIEDIKGLLI
jgi:SNF2 family DNA or RNA helicase